MKVAITFHITDKDRLLYGVRATGTMVPAKREAIVKIIEEDVYEGLEEQRDIFDRHTTEVLALLNKEDNKK